MREVPAKGMEVPIDTQTTLSMLEENPEEVYRRLRREMPIARLKAIGRIVFTKAEDTYRVKTDLEHFGSFDTTTPMQRAFGGHTLMRKDGCEHLRERQAMESAFKPSLLYQHWKPKFERLTDRLIEKLATRETADLLHDLAAPLSAGYLKLLLGIEGVTDEQLFDWASALIRGAMNAAFDPAIFESSDQANEEMNECFDQMIELHLKSPDCSVLSSMANQSDPIALSQIRTNMKICIGGAVIETRDALLSTLCGLLSHPDQLWYCRDQKAWDRACEEGLRWVAPIQASPRIVKKALIMRGVIIPEGETVMAIQASANHDEDVWDQPHQFNVHREPRVNQTFGNGPHKCLGGDMYRLLISEVTLPKLFDRFPVLSLNNRIAVNFRGFAFRGPTSLPVIFK
ncbi:MAG: cytochrome P450 [Sneathiella sp.]|uniref:cytochrome P450 n=1 Tax=Sneathiella sp. TaxID=1964365 RepID=UPI003002ECFF